MWNHGSGIISGRAALRAYRILQGALGSPRALGAFFPRAGALREGRRILDRAIPGRDPAKARLWFHAASAGELESLWSVAAALASGGAEVAVTVFSESGSRPLERLASELEALGAKPVYAGFCPWEGSWGAALDRVLPDVFVTARYEAWPELWASLAERSIPLVVAAAMERSSLRFGARAARFLAGATPPLDLCAIEERDAEALRSAFPGARVHASGDPRWDRVFERAGRGHPRARELGVVAGALPRPFGLLAQVWPEDLDAWGESLRALPGSFWVVPHSLDERVLSRLEERLARLGLATARSSGGEACPGWRFGWPSAAASPVRNSWSSIRSWPPCSGRACRSSSRSISCASAWQTPPSRRSSTTCTRR